MQHYSIKEENKWDYENGFYLTCETSRLGKFINHLELYKRIINLPGDILEFGVYKGSSLIRLLSFREMLEFAYSRTIYGFDIFGKFPDELEMESDKKFVEKFENEGGWGISVEDLTRHIDNKGFKNYELIKGNVLHTIPLFLERNPALRIALLHIDVDVYEPSLAILNNLWDRVVSGGVLMLDDYGLIEGETRAVDEFFMGKNITIYKSPYSRSPAYIIKP